MVSACVLTAVWLHGIGEVMVMLMSCMRPIARRLGDSKAASHHESIVAASPTAMVPWCEVKLQRSEAC